MSSVGLVLLQLAVLEKLIDVIVILTGSPIAQYIGWLIGLAIVSFPLSEALATSYADRKRKRRRKPKPRRRRR